MRDAFFELVLYPVKGFRTGDRTLHHGRKKPPLCIARGAPAPTIWPRRARALFQADADLSADYNHKLAGGKWDHMMDQTHLGYTSWQEPPKNVIPEVREIDVRDGAHMGVAVEGASLPSPIESYVAPVLTFDVFNQQRRYIDVFRAGKEMFDFSAVASAPWIVVRPTRGNVDKDQRLWVTIDWDKAPWEQSDGSVTITGPDGQATKVALAVFNPREPHRKGLRGFVEGTASCRSRPSTIRRR